METIIPRNLNSGAITRRIGKAKRKAGVVIIAAAIKPLPIPTIPSGERPTKKARNDNTTPQIKNANPHEPPIIELNW